MTFEDITNSILLSLRGYDGINTVTFGDAAEVDLSTITNFLLAHLTAISTTHNGSISTHLYQLLILDKAADNLSDEKIKALSRTNAVMSNVLDQFEYTTYSNLGFSIEILPTAEVMYDQYANRLYGYAVNLSIQTRRDVNCG